MQDYDDNREAFYFLAVFFAAVFLALGFAAFFAAFLGFAAFFLGVAFVTPPFTGFFTGNTEMKLKLFVFNVNEIRPQLKYYVFAVTQHFCFVLGRQAGSEIICFIQLQKYNTNTILKRKQRKSGHFTSVQRKGK